MIRLRVKDLGLWISGVGLWGLELLGAFRASSFSTCGLMA